MSQADGGGGTTPDLEELLATLADQEAEMDGLRREIDELRTQLLAMADTGDDVWTRLGLSEGERRTVTVLFADVSGFTTMAEGLDPEDCTVIMRDTLRGLAKVVTDNGGYVEKFIGDAVCALFGAPVAYEDEPQRAARAALEMHAFLERLAGLRPHLPALTVHIGINTGTVIAGEIGDGSQFGVMGDTINTAARLMDAATSRQTFVAAATAARLRGSFELVAAGSRALKGKKQEIVAYELVGPATGASIDPVETPFIGRTEPLALLVADARPSLVVLTGPPGIGKSRLLREAVETIESKLLVTLATARAHGARPGQVVADALAPILAALPDGDLQRQCVGFLDETFENLPPEFEPILAEALCQSATRSPVAIFIDGYEQADPGSAALLAYLVRQTQGAPITWTVAAREHAAVVVELLTRLGELATEWQVPPLPRDETERLLDALLPGALDPSTRRHLAEVAAGSPEYCGELARALIDQELVVPMGNAWEAVGDITRLETPESLRELIEARLERLDTSSRRVLQAAAVIGVRFSLGLLGHTADEPDFVDAALDELERLQMLVAPDDDSPDGYWSFRTPLLRSVVYDSVLRRRRPEFHRRVADGLVEMHPGDEVSMAELLGFHYEQARDAERAQHYLQVAAERAHLAHAFAAAADLRGRALVLLADDDPSGPTLRQRRAEARLLSGDLDGACVDVTRLRERGETTDAPERLAWLELVVAASRPDGPATADAPKVGTSKGSDAALVAGIGRLVAQQLDAALVQFRIASERATTDGDYLLHLLADELEVETLGRLGRTDEVADAAQTLESRARARGDEVGRIRAQHLARGTDQKALGVYGRLLGEEDS